MLESYAYIMLVIATYRSTYRISTSTLFSKSCGYSGYKKKSESLKSQELVAFSAEVKGRILNSSKKTQVV